MPLTTTKLPGQKIHNPSPSLYLDLSTIIPIPGHRIKTRDPRETFRKKTVKTKENRS